MSLQEVDVGVSHADADTSRLRAPCSRDKATIPVAGNMEWSVGVQEGGPATTGAQRGARQRSTSGWWSDEEVRLRKSADDGTGLRDPRRTSGYVSDDAGVQHIGGVIGKTSPSPMYATSDVNVKCRRQVLKSPADFSATGREYHPTTPSSPRDVQVTLTQGQLEDVLRRACADAVRSSGAAWASDVMESVPESTMARHVGTPTGSGCAAVATDAPRRPSASRRSSATVRCRSSSPGGRSEDEFYDAEQWPSTSRSSSRSRQSCFRDRKSSSTGATEQPLEAHAKVTTTETRILEGTGQRKTVVLSLLLRLSARVHQRRALSG